MVKRPPTPLTRPHGYVYVAVPAGPEWKVRASGRGCRYVVGPGNSTCKRPGVVVLYRTAFSLRGTRQVPYAYCGELEHMYGKWVEDGRVMQWVLRPEARDD